VLEKIFSGKVNKLTLAILDTLTYKNREALLPAIAEEFHNAYNTFKGIGKATVTTTVPMDNEGRDKIKTIVRKLSQHKEIELDEKVDKELVGGFILNVGDQQIDASIRSKLKSLTLNFSENPYIREY